MQTALVPIAKATEVIQSDEAGILNQIFVTEETENTLVKMVETSMSPVCRDVAEYALIALRERRAQYQEETISDCIHLTWSGDLIPVVQVLTNNPLRLERGIVNKAQDWTMVKGPSFLVAYEIEIIKQLPLYGAIVSVDESNHLDVLICAVREALEMEYGSVQLRNYI